MRLSGVGEPAWYQSLISDTIRTLTPAAAEHLKPKEMRGQPTTQFVTGPGGQIQTVSTGFLKNVKDDPKTIPLLIAAGVLVLILVMKK